MKTIKLTVDNREFAVSIPIGGLSESQIRNITEIAMQSVVEIAQATMDEEENN